MANVGCAGIIGTTQSEDIGARLVSVSRQCFARVGCCVLQWMGTCAVVKLSGQLRGDVSTMEKGGQLS